MSGEPRESLEGVRLEKLAGSRTWAGSLGNRFEAIRRSEAFAAAASPNVAGGATSRSDGYPSAWNRDRDVGSQRSPRRGNRPSRRGASKTAFQRGARERGKYKQESRPTPLSGDVPKK